MPEKMCWSEGCGHDLIKIYDPEKSYIVHVFCIEQGKTLKGETVKFLPEARVLYVKTRSGFVVMICHETEHIKWRERETKRGG